MFSDNNSRYTRVIIIIIRRCMDTRNGPIVRIWWLYTEIENYPERGRDSLKQFQNFPKSFLSALIKFVPSKPIIYENKTIWKRWCSNTLRILSLSIYIYFLSVSFYSPCLLSFVQIHIHTHTHTNNIIAYSTTV